MATKYRKKMITEVDEYIKTANIQLPYESQELKIEDLFLYQYHKSQASLKQKKILS